MTVGGLMVLTMMIVVNHAMAECWLDWSVEQTSEFAADFVDAQHAPAVTKAIDRHAISVRHMLYMSNDESMQSVNSSGCLNTKLCKKKNNASVSSAPHAGPHDARASAIL
jgi:hypothetical protein